MLGFSAQTPYCLHDAKLHVRIVQDDASETGCVARGCCWAASQSGTQGVPYCFYPKNYDRGYVVTQLANTNVGVNATLTLPNSVRTPFGNDVRNVSLSIWEETQQRLHFKLGDATQARWEPPVNTPAPPSTKPANTDYQYTVKQNPFSIEVTRKSTGTTLFNSTVPLSGDRFGNMVYSNQFLEISSTLPSNPMIYGLGEHITPLKLDTSGSSGQVYTLLARDQGTPVHRTMGATNLYASHPFYMLLDPEDGTAHGVFLLNSNAMEVTLHTPSDSDEPAFITYRATGGLLDFYVFSGPTPEEVVKQYLEVIGKPFLPPYWGLGFNLCRWGYNSLAQTQKINDGMRAAGLPQDVQWNDIDYMDRHFDFTTDPAAFPGSEFGEWVGKTLPSYGQHYVPIFDPAISSSQGAGNYPPFDQGVEQNVFIKNSTGGIFIGSVWPGLTAFPDFFHPNGTSYWVQQMKQWHDIIPFDSAWIDMNEPSNFCNGQCPGGKPLPPLDTPGPAGAIAVEVQVAPTPAPETAVRTLRGAAPAAPSTGTGFDPFFPPFLPGREGGLQLIDTKTVSFAASQYTSSHYNLHNMYGWSENIATKTALDTIRGERSFVISRSTFPSSGVHGGHWLGDNNASWDDLYYSIPGMLTMQMFGIPFVGADVCGFGGTTTPELCTRWQQLGAFYPFYRNHNTIGTPEQAPYVFGAPYTGYIRDVITLRYTLLPTLYTLLFQSHMEGGTVTRPLFFEWPASAPSVLPTLDTQFLWGRFLMISPVITQGATTKKVFFPDAVNTADQEGWYDWFEGAKVNAANAFLTLQAPLGVIPVHVRGGAVIATQDAAMTTVAAVDNAFRLTVALRANNGTAEGSLIVDDGTSLDSASASKYLSIGYTASSSSSGAQGAVESKVLVNGFAPAANATLWSVRVLGVQSYAATGGSVFCNNAPASYEYDASNKVLDIDCTGTATVPTARAAEFVDPAELSTALAAAGDFVEVTTGLSMTAPVSVSWK